ncbi:MAG: hypothetical protein O3A28_00815 [Actinomycetota bacterium]|jgi:hypothetical protein|nr:hypothetical protein [Ilumatobacteraceae bacterium]MDA2959961.1 hypothetical protein [Actinomycetota bacterium]MDA3006340.1 hypothetical protein [Actinomycetota bacterium]MDA3033554.1 hypothetical protein [Actinomycetota bacterium]
MREILSLRFVATVVALILSVVAVSRIAGGEDTDGGTVDVGSSGEVDPDMVRRIDLVDVVADIESENGRSGTAGFAVVDGVAAHTARLILDDLRAVDIVTGTPGVDNCPVSRRVGRCAVLADMLGEAVLWFSLEPVDADMIELGTVRAFDDEWAVLSDGFALPHAPVFVRRCATEFESFTQWRRELGDDYVTMYSLAERELTDVVCT